MNEKKPRLAERSADDGKTARKPKCPMCRKPVERRPSNESFPFCTEHCRMHDLGNWLDELYTLSIGHDGTERTLPDPQELN